MSRKQLKTDRNGHTTVQADLQKVYDALGPLMSQLSNLGLDVQSAISKYEKTEAPAYQEATLLAGKVYACSTLVEQVRCDLYDFMCGRGRSIGEKE